MEVSTHKMSRLYREIVKLVDTGILEEPFRVADIKATGSILDNSPAFLSKHTVGNPGKYFPYFKRKGPLGTGKYVLNKNLPKNISTT